MKTLMSLSAGTAIDTLQTLQNNRITCQYKGIDQSGRMIMEVEYDSSQVELIKKLNTEIHTFEKILTTITIFLEDALKKCVAESTYKIKAN